MWTKIKRHATSIGVSRTEDSGIRVDFPQEAETIASPNYTFRLGTQKGIKMAEVSINGSEWLPCRPAAGFWWYDWQGYSPGSYSLYARAKNENGEVALSPPRRFKVQFPEANSRKINKPLTSEDFEI